MLLHHLCPRSCCSSLVWTSTHGQFCEGTFEARSKTMPDLWDDTIEPDLDEWVKGTVKVPCVTLVGCVWHSAPSRLLQCLTMKLFFCIGLWSWFAVLFLKKKKKKKKTLR
eukprot:NODE_1580_length_905_cov_539.358645_g1232_i0.p2 GENE.NODE_1580_length_905_cov_539.358645_g1232_i0~~NODE_1580_length_905_cov_539.358645_g1232_i0.p2  ORF type:complete len:110 (+),score=17.56 NODE_1580_length_905_cov_539.358645_g1232_i0:572-901(+)